MGETFLIWFKVWLSREASIPKYQTTAGWRVNIGKNHQIWPGLGVVKRTLSCWRNTGADLRGNAQQNGTTGWKPWCSGYRLSVMIIDPEFKSRMLKWIFVAIICCQCKLSLQRPKKCKRSQVWWTLKNNILWIIFCCDLFVRRRLKVPFNGTYNLLRFVQ